MFHAVYLIVALILVNVAGLERNVCPMRATFIQMYLTAYFFDYQKLFQFLKFPMSAQNAVLQLNAILQLPLLLGIVISVSQHQN